LGHSVVFPWKKQPLTLVSSTGRNVTDVVTCRRLSSDDSLEPGHIYFIENTTQGRR